MNKRILPRLPVWIVIATLVAACSATTPPTNYYSLYKPPTATAAHVTAGTALTLSIGPVTIPDILRQAQIATTGDDGSYRLASYHRWSGELDREIARAIAEELALTLGTEQVAIFPWDVQRQPDFRVIVDILSLSGRPGKDALLSARWILLDPRTKAPAATQRSEFLRVPEAPGYAAWVDAQRGNLTSLSHEIARALQQLPAR